jgi:hypothetical protein
MDQTFYTINGSFPALKYRIEVNESKTVKRSLSIIESALLHMKRSTFELNLETQFLTYVFENENRKLLARRIFAFVGRIRLQIHGLGWFHEIVQKSRDTSSKAGLQANICAITDALEIVKKCEYEGLSELPAIEALFKGAQKGAESLFPIMAIGCLGIDWRHSLGTCDGVVSPIF